MSAPRGRGLRPGGVIRALGRLVLLVGIGFGAGLVIGVISEEPALLAGHLRGQSESVALFPDGASDEVPGPASEHAFDDRAAERNLASGDASQSRGAIGWHAQASGPAGDFDAAERRAEAMQAKPEAEAAARALPSVAAAVRPSASSTPATQPGEDRASAATRDPEVGPGARAWAIQVGAFSDEQTALRVADGLDEKGYPVEIVPANRESNRWRVRVQPLASEQAAREMADRLKRDERMPTWVLPMEGRGDS